MIEFRIGGRKVRPENMADALEAAMLEAVKEDLHRKIGSLRDPETGESPVVIVTGPDLDRLSIKVEGSEPVVAMVKERLCLDTEEAKSIEANAESGTERPLAFLCHASEDKETARTLGEDLLAKGIDVFFDEWDIRAGDSLRQKIDVGLNKCTHFLVLLSPMSMSKPWVNAEMDAGYARRLKGMATFIALRMGVAAGDLPPLLEGLYAPSLDDYEPALEQLVADIHGISKRPPLGPPPTAKAIATGRLGLSPAAEALVKLFVERSEHGDSHDPILEGKELQEATGLGDDDLVDAVDELEGQDYVRKQVFLGCGPLGFSGVFPLGALFGDFDGYFQPWTPSEDAMVLVSRLLDAGGRWLRIADAAAKLEWEPRRMNPAVHHLLRRRVVEASRECGSHPWACGALEGSAATRRFAKTQGR